LTTADNVESRLARLEGASEHWATKADVARLEGKIDALEARLETKIDALEARLETKIDGLEASGLQSRVLLQFMGFAIAIVAATVGLTKLLALVG
jgi:hypothetical protein